MSESFVNLIIPVPSDLAKAHAVESMGIDERLEFVVRYLIDDEGASCWGVICCGHTLASDLPKGSALTHIKYLTRPDHSPQLTRRVIFTHTDWTEDEVDGRLIFVDKSGAPWTPEVQ